MKKWLKTIMYSVLLLLTIALSVVIMPIGFIVSFIVSARHYSLNEFLLRICVTIDQSGNVICQELFNWALIKPNSPYKFGNEDETISSVIGKNKRAGTLSFVGIKLQGLLDRLDDNHSEKSIEEGAPRIS